MNGGGLENAGPDDSRRSAHVAALLAVGGAGMVFLLGVGAAYTLALTSSGALATTAAVLVTAGLAGLLVPTGVVAARSVLPGRNGEGGPGGRRPELVPARPTGEPDRELFRILDDVRFGELRLRRRPPLHDRRGTA